MVHCTRAAASSLARFRDENGIPATFGVRLFAAQAADGRTALGLEFADEPVEGDQVTEEHGTRVIVAPELADQLRDVTIDVTSDPSSNGDEPAQLVLREAESPSGPP